MFDKFIMASQMIAIIEENKRQRLLAEIDRYDPKVVATIKEVFTKMAGGEYKECDISEIFAKNENKEFRNQFIELTGKFGYTVVVASGVGKEQWYLSTIFPKSEKFPKK